MRGRSIFRLTLLLPFITPILALCLGLEIAGFLGMATFIISLPYIIFASIMWRLFGSYSSYKQAYILIAKAPIIAFVPIASILLFGLIASGSEPAIAIKSSGNLLLVCLATAYMYCALAALITLIANFSGIAKEYL
jgi:hypothetical protein